MSEIELAGFSLLPSERVGPGRIAEAPVSMECRRYVTLQPGPERYIVLGEVVMLHVRDGIVDPERLRIDRDAFADRPSVRRRLRAHPRPLRDAPDQLS
jgi:flavin reductase (DIM6/NTAB) family NADH-FMN oxidoreductase RutF